MELLLALGRGNDLVPRYDGPILLKHFRTDIHIEGGEKDLSLSFFHSHRRDVLFKLFDSCDDVTDGLLLALFESAQAKDSVMLSINRIDDDTSALSDVFVPRFNRGTVLLALCGSGAII
jgi:hypothetical protein